jgi:hypothetical protein
MLIFFSLSRFSHLKHASEIMMVKKNFQIFSIFNINIKNIATRRLTVYIIYIYIYIYQMLKLTFFKP